jgi:hypothetical protein
MDDLKERLRAQAERVSDIHRRMAEDKSLRQPGNHERRTDLYMWPTPEQTIESKAAAYIEALEQRVSELEEALQEAVSYQQEAVSYHDGPTYAWILRAKQALAKARNEQVKQ